MCRIPNFHCVFILTYQNLLFLFKIKKKFNFYFILFLSSYEKLQNNLIFICVFFQSNQRKMKNSNRIFGVFPGECIIY